MKHIHEILQLQKLSTGKKIDIPANVYAINVYGDLYLKTKCIMCDINKYNIKVPKNELDNKKVIFGEYSINFEILDCISDYHDKNNLIKYFDYNIIKDSITIRTRKDGDKMIPLGMSSNKKLKDIFINMKIPKLQRDVLPILQFDDEIAWVVSVKLGDKFKITSKTNKILKITVCREV